MYYGVFFVLTVPFLAVRPTMLLLWAAAVAVIGPVLVFLARNSSTVTDVLTTIDPIDLLSHEGITKLVVTGVYPALTWLPYLLVGLAVGRIGFGRIRSRILVFHGAVLMAVGYGGAALAAVVSPLPTDEVDDWGSLVEESLSGTSIAMLAADSSTNGFPAIDWRWLFEAYPHSGTPFEIAGGVGTALLVLGIAPSDRQAAVGDEPGTPAVDGPDYDVAAAGPQYTTIVTRDDEFVVPVTRQFLQGPNVNNIVVQEECEVDRSERGQMLHSRRVWHLVLDALDPAHATPAPCIPVDPASTS